MFGFKTSAVIAAAFSAIAFFSSPAFGATVALDIGGPADGFDPLGPPSLAVAANEGAAATFQVNSALTNASFDFGLYCFSQNGCSGLAYLTNSPLGPSGSIAGLMSVVNVSGGFGTTTVNSAFTGMNLLSGTYSVVLWMTQGLSSWVGSQSPVFSGDGRVASLSSSLIPTAQGNYFPTSAFVGANSTFQYVLRADAAVSAVPLPASGFLLIGAMGAFGALRSKRKST